MDTTKLTDSIFDLLDETFENHHGFYTYEGTSLLKTLAGITAEEASIPVGGSCPTLAAQVAHTAFYLDVQGKSMRGEDEEVDWEDIWNRTGAVTPDEWEALKSNLKHSYDRVVATARTFEGWDTENSLIILAIIAHSAYHLGVIRQSLCILRPEKHE